MNDARPLSLFLSLSSFFFAAYRTIHDLQEWLVILSLHFSSFFDENNNGKV